MNPRLLRKAKTWDRLARWAITAGGLAVIASVIAILFLIVEVTVPLFQPASSKQVAARPAPTGTLILGLGLDEYLENGFTIDAQGKIAIFPLQENAAPPATLLALPEGAPLAALSDEGGNRFTALRRDGRIDIFRVRFSPQFADGRRTLQPSLEIIRRLPPFANCDPVRASSRGLEDEGLVTAALCTDNSFAIQREKVEIDLFGEENRAISTFRIPPPEAERISAFTLSEEGDRLYSGTNNGLVFAWRLGEESAELQETVKVFSDGTGISSLALVFGSISLAVGGGDGSLTTWMPVPGPTPGSKVLRRIHELRSHSAPVVTIIPSRRDKSLISIDAGGSVYWDHMTSERNLLALFPERPVRLAALAGRNNGLLTLDKGGTLHALAISCPHPEVSWRTLFGKVWYESYPKPDYVWQSSSGSDDFEPKFSITPLLFGTVKGTLYAMLFAVPLAIFGAVYVSQFCRGPAQRLIKPTVEIMASIPSVVIGFLAALWLAPIVEGHLLSLFVAVILIPSFFLVFMAFWQQATERSLAVRHMRKGYEFLIVTPVLLLAVAAAVALGPALEQWFFAGNFKDWLYSSVGVTYDQRNCIIIAFGLGFTVVPIIFSIAEDALSNVPPSLSAASLALGASRWQTVWRVVLPSASPGIFAGIMIGFGRAVGETMIVLMATGNTPIMDWSIFNGMRTLSANIAVEIPEAPVGGTLYRVLFLCAVILFAMTFVLNTGAELVRERLRKKYMRY